MKTSPEKLPALVLALGLLLQLLWHGLLLAQTAGAEEFLKDIDFRIIYTAGQIAREGDWNAIYDLERQHRTQEQITGRALEQADVLPFNHPPTLLPLQWLIAFLPYSTAYLLWAGVLAFFSLLNGGLVWRLARDADWPAWPAALLAAQAFLFYPLWVSINKGQDTLFALIGLTILLLGAQTGRERLSGLGLALLTLRPQFAVPLAVPFLFRQRQTGWWFAGFAALLVIYSVLMVGWKGVTDFLHLLALTSSGETVLIHHADMYNLKGLLLRLLPAMSIETASGISWAVFALVLVILCWWWVRAEQIGFQRISLAVSLSLFASPHLHYHDVGFLLIPSLGLLLAFTAEGRLTSWQAAFLLMSESLYLGIIHLTPFREEGVYLLMLGLAVLAGLANRLPANHLFKNLP